VILRLQLKKLTKFVAAFLYDFHVPYTKNLAEQGIHMVIARKHRKKNIKDLFEITSVKPVVN
jgi:hypothetical protein